MKLLKLRVMIIVKQGLVPMILWWAKVMIWLLVRMIEIRSGDQTT